MKLEVNLRDVPLFTVKSIKGHSVEIQFSKELGGKGEFLTIGDCLSVDLNLQGSDSDSGLSKYSLEDLVKAFVKRASS